MQLSDILKDSDYRHAQFDLTLIYEFERRIIVRVDNKGKEIPYVNCLICKKDIRLTPEEAIRQLYLEILLKDYKYPAERIELEYAVAFGRGKKRADIVIFDKDNTTAPYIIDVLDFRRLKVVFHDMGSESKAKPYGVNGAVIVYAVLDAPPADVDALTRSLLAKRKGTKVSLERNRKRNCAVGGDCTTRKLRERRRK
jgi:hypothetical protein